MVFRLFSRASVAIVLGLGTIVCAPTITLAQTKAEVEMARGLMDEGDAQAEKGDFRGALRSYRAAHTIMNVPTTGIDVARMEAKLGKLVEARKIALEIVAMPVKPREPKPFVEARDEAQRLADELETKIPRLTIEVKGAISSAPIEIKIDGRSIASEEARSPQPLDPGKHDVSVAGMGSKTIELVERQRLTVTFDADAPESSERPSKRVSPLVYVGFGLGGAGIIAGAVAGALSLSRANAVESLCPGGACPDQTALDKATPMNESGFVLANVSNVAFALGVVGVGLGVTGLVLSGREAKKPADSSALHVFVGPNGALLTGSF